MVLLRVRSQGDALFRHTIVPWIVDAGAALVDALGSLLPELRTRLEAEEFLQRYELWFRGSPIDVYSTPDVLQLGAGSEIFVKARRGPEMRGRDEFSRVPESTISGGLGTDPQQIASRILFDEFLEAHHLAFSKAELQSIGISSLVELCCRSSDEVANAIARTEGHSGTSKVGLVSTAYRLITQAHEELVRRRISFEWASRLKALYRIYNPAKVDQVPSLLEAYVGEEEDLWYALREKYEPHAAATPSNSPPRSSTTAAGPQTGQIASCPACGHNFMVEAKNHLQDLEERRQLHEDYSRDRERWRIREKELEGTIERLKNEASDARQRADHFEGMSKEQEVWLGLVEKRLAAAEDQLVQRQLVAVKHVPDDPRPVIRDSAEIPVRQAPASPKLITKFSPEDRASLRKRLVSFYLRYSPEKIELVDHVLAQWKGREKELERLISVEPSIVRLQE